MNLKAFFTKNWQHIAAIAFIFILAAVFFKPQFDGLALDQHDVKQWKGMSHEVIEHRELYGEEPLWTNSMFGGMPATQISVIYAGNWFASMVSSFNRLFPPPVGVVIIHLIGFYILGRFLKVKPIIALIGAVMFSFASYEIIILQAGHNSKAFAVGFMAPLLGAFIASYRDRKWWIVLFAGIFMAFELAMNHLQVTYYFVILLLFIGVYFFVDSILKKSILSFFAVTGGLIFVFVLALLVNSGNIFGTNDYAKHTIRGANDITINPDGTKVTNASSGLDKDYITNWSYGIGETFTLLSPNVKGGGSFPIGNSPFEEIVDNSDLSSSEITQLKKMPAYWGDQPFTSGPVYIGVITILLAILGLFFLKGGLKWVLFGTSILAIALSWGKNFMGLTDFFIDFIPGYNKFRTVTIILVVVELCMPVLAVLLLQKLIDNRELFVEKKAKFISVIGGFVLFLIILMAAGLGDNYTNQRERDQYATIEEDIRGNILSMDPQVLKTQYNLDVNNATQVNQFVQQQADPYYEGYENLKMIREDIFMSSMMRSILFAIIAGAFLIVYLFTSIPAIVLGGGILALVMIDVVPVSYQYLGAQEEGNGLKYWTEKSVIDFPLTASAADEQIMELELKEKPSLQAKIDAAERNGRQKADELGYVGISKKNLIDSKRFSALNFNTNYRVFDLSGGFSSSEASYFHKSLGGYHGAKLRNINNIFDFHLSKMNNAVYDMLNVKYFIQKDDSGVASVRPNPSALGNVWLVKGVKSVESPNDEIRALGKQFRVSNKGKGKFLINGKSQTEEIVYGSERIEYLIQGFDTIKVPLSNGLRKGQVALFVQDVNGVTNLIPKMTLDLDTANSFKALVEIEVISEFVPSEEAIMLKSEAAKLTSQKFSGEGEVKMNSYRPNLMKYSADVKGKQLAVFSEIYYPDGWKVLVDGKEKEILKVDYLLRGVELDGGKHSIEMVYAPEDFKKYATIGTIGSLSFWILLPLIGIFYEVRRRRSVVEDSK